MKPETLRLGMRSRTRGSFDRARPQKSPTTRPELYEQKHSTRGSRVIPQHSTNLAQTRLTSEIGRDRVLSGWYDRAMGLKDCSSYIYQGILCVQVCTNLVLATHACPEVPTMVARLARRTCVCTSVATTCLGEQESPEFGDFLPRNSWCLVPVVVTGTCSSF